MPKANAAAAAFSRARQYLYVAGLDVGAFAMAGGQDKR